MFNKKTLIICLVLIAIACAGLYYAGHGKEVAYALGGLPFVFGATKVRDGMEMFRTIKATNAGATVTDTVYLMNGRVLLALNSAGAGVANTYLMEGVIEYARATGATWTAGDALYWDDTAKNFTKTVGSNTKCGIAMQDAASADTTGFVYIVPSP